MHVPAHQQPAPDGQPPATRVVTAASGRNTIWPFWIAALLLHIVLLSALPKAEPAEPLAAAPPLLARLKSLPVQPPPVVDTLPAPAPAPQPPVQPGQRQPRNAAPQKQPAGQPAAKPATPAAAGPPAPSSPIAAQNSSGPAVAAGDQSAKAGAPNVPNAGGASDGGSAGGSGAGSGGSSSAGSGGSGTGLTAPAKPQPPKPKPPPPPAPAVDVKALLSDYAAGVKRAIVRQKTYPEIAERLGHEGSVKISFTLSADGSLESVSIRSSSGFDELDEAALAAVRDAAPFDALPEEAGRSELALSITLNFNLH